LTVQSEPCAGRYCAAQGVVLMAGFVGPQVNGLAGQIEGSSA